MKAAPPDSPLAREIAETLLIARGAYAPYSRFRVGALLISESGQRYSGVNIENRSFGLTVCAERCAVFKAVQANDLKWKRLIIAGLDSPDPLPPCGACRQVLSEFSRCLTLILVNQDGHYLQTTLSKLYPMDSLHSLKG